MIRFAVAAFLIAHGLVHLAVYAAPKDPTKPAPFDTGRSWVLAAGHTSTAVMRSTSVVLAAAVAAAYTVAGIAVAIGAPAWAEIAAAAAVLGIAFKALWFHPWLTFGVALDVAVLVAALAGWPASL